ncbi:MAG: GerMN domain-containing protein [Thermoanaerobaculia bacterium]
MSRRAAWLLVGGVALAALLAWWLAPGRRDHRGSPGAGEAGTNPAERRTVTLYFPGPAEGLVAERRTVAGGDDEEVARVILAELLSGPREEELYAPLPDDTEVAAVHIGRTGIAYVDLRMPEGTSRPSLGSQQELLAAYSLVNSLCENLPRLAGVALLWNGTQSPTFAGNLDTRRPLVPNRSLVAPAA